ncbi:pyruvate, phosphate dikinase [Listeria monocytogenes]|uniref:Pyruvate, phosphate dikinase n=2 Tax=Listeria monocytogenes TaxID=1639 RepID=Q8Y633_LISMO|nr:pyruvate, phosphate dikinase [Listeria monocytogenes]NP_465392.1 pyruvate phosphate dikinase [Listeria monocytogenes EGD-e]EAE3701643.1 pyruvate, phosphate dikinase [Listeria monocytogenes serotype 1/2c]AEO26215.1 pyruvate phosphate dikinase [Listeria monocytogenes FSL R2-561]ASH47531.1 pyruvate, phosphate dikinase [Listeria monocytogenes serotype 1/2c str. 10-5025]ASH50450.1 pyruvate, phosphate dikinase [Listeria monocytogenes serotype 1/2c str. 10-5026]ASH53372.1 pyruvate, phosphate diki
MRKFVYQFSEGSKEMKNLLGGKGANLAEMTNIGLPVPPGFIISTDACNDYTANNKHLSEAIFDEVKIHLAELEKQTGKIFGFAENPLLVSVRSGAPFSMPGMMDTVLNLGLNDQAAEGLANLTGDARSAYDSYRRFIQMFGDVVFEIPSYHFEQALSRIKKANDYRLDTELTATDLSELIDAYKLIFSQATGTDFPQDPLEQLRLAIIAVFDSWMNPRAVIYRRLHDIDASFGTAVNIQAMVFGNTGETSGTGITFTRNPSTGEKKVFGEFLLNAQGEDVVAGIRTPEPISALEERMPTVYKELLHTCELLENHYLDMQDIEFTIEKGKLYVLQTRSGKRTAKAAIQTAVDFVQEGKITRQEAIMRVETKQLHQLLHPTFDESALKNGQVIATGLPASPGAATGQIFFAAKEAVQATERGIPVILVRNETSPEDIEGMARSNAILTAHGGMTSHAAVVARGMGKCCIAGCAELTINEKEKTIILPTGDTLHEGDALSLDGSSGKVYLGEIALREAQIGGHFDELMAWADTEKRLMIRVNADTPPDFKKALLFGAEGIGLCRTEHMFFDEKRIHYVRQMILAESLSERESVLTTLKEMQKADFSELFRIADGRAVNIRLLDPPLHEFLPKTKQEIEQLASAMNRTVPQITKRINELSEANPMLGHRGCRLAITFPEIYRMQTEAIIESAVTLHDEGIDVHPEIMIPLIATKSELSYIKKEMKHAIHTIFDRERVMLPYDIGTMIEIPRACVTADEIAEEAEFFSFGTNDLTQLTYGFSRDDATKFLADYYEKDILSKDPFVSIDKNGVGALVEMAVTRGRMTSEHLKMGVCGEHGGDPESIQFFHQLGLTYVSCSPYRVPIARLAAAQAALAEKHLIPTI